MPTVKFIHSAMSGAPTLTGQAGSLIALLDACLVNGFGAGTVDSLVIAGGVATVTRAAGHPFGASEVAQIAGATVTGGSVNGDQAVLSATSTSYTFAATGIPNQTASGTITHKVAPLGWTKPYSGTNLAAYRSADTAGTQAYLRVDDTGTTNARVVGYEAMSGISTGTGPFPTAAQLSGGVWWPKSSSADATARAWVLVGDGRAFYFAAAHSAGYTSYNTSYFGDFASTKSPDGFGCAIAGCGYDLSSYVPGYIQEQDISALGSVSAVFWAARGTSGLGGSTRLKRGAYSPTGFGPGQFSGETGGSAMGYPNPADNGLYVSPITLSEQVTPISFRGQLPGAWFSVQAIGIGPIATRDSVTGVVGLAGRTLRAINNYNGPMFYDVTGPWAR